MGYYIFIVSDKEGIKQMEIIVLLTFILVAVAWLKVGYKIRTDRIARENRKKEDDRKRTERQRLARQKAWYDYMAIHEHTKAVNAKPESRDRESFRKEYNNIVYYSHLEKRYMTILELSDGFTMGDLKRAYKEKAGKYHPDRGNPPEIMANINVAYEQLKKSIRG